MPRFLARTLAKSHLGYQTHTSVDASPFALLAAFAGWIQYGNEMLFQTFTTHFHFTLLHKKPFAAGFRSGTAARGVRARCLWPDERGGAT